MSRDPNTAARVHRARKAHRCDDYVCRRGIRAGEQYTRHVCFPGHDANGGKQPWALKLCQACHPIEPHPKEQA